MVEYNINENDVFLVKQLRKVKKLSREKKTKSIKKNSRL